MSTALFNRLFGRKKVTSTSLEAEIQRQESALAEAHARIEAAERAGVAAFEAGDRDALSASEALKADAALDIRLVDHALTALRTELGNQRTIEEREEFQRQVVTHVKAAEALAARIRRDYGLAAETIASLIADLRSYDDKADALRQKGKGFGETISFPDVEAFRHGPLRWTVTYPNPNGIGVIQCCAEDAPRGSVEWVDGAPIAARDGVKVRSPQRDYALSLLSIGTLPAVYAGDPAIYSAPGEPIRMPNGPYPGGGQ